MKKKKLQRVVVTAATISLFAPTILTPIQALAEETKASDSQQVEQEQETKESQVEQPTVGSIDKSLTDNGLEGMGENGHEVSEELTTDNSEVEGLPDNQNSNIEANRDIELSADDNVVQPADLGNSNWLITEINRRFRPKKVGKNVTVGDLKTITSLGVIGDKIIDETIPAEINKLVNLEVLNLSSNTKLIGAIPKELGDLKKLNRIEFSGTLLTGIVPDEVFALPAITSANFNNSRITLNSPDPKPFDNGVMPDYGATFVNGRYRVRSNTDIELSNYETTVRPFDSTSATFFNLQFYADASGKYYTMSPSHIYTIRDANSGAILYKGVADPSVEIPITRDTQYRVVVDDAELNPRSQRVITVGTAEDTKIVQPADLGNSNWLITEINRRFSPKKVGKNVTVGDLKTITSLDVNGNKIIDETIPAEINKLVNLEVLNLSSNTKLIGTIPKELGDLKKLKKIEFSGTLLTGIVPDEVFALPAITSASFNNSRITLNSPDPKPFDNGVMPDYGATFVNSNYWLTGNEKIRLSNYNIKIKPFDESSESYFNLKFYSKVFGQSHVMSPSHVYTIIDMNTGIEVYKGVADSSVEFSTAKDTKYKVIVDGAEQNPRSQREIEVVNGPLADATKAVEDLFKDNSHNELADGVSQETIDAAKDLVNALPESAEKAALKDLIEQAQKLLDESKKEAAAQASVDALFRDTKKDALADKIAQAQIDAAKGLVNELKDGDKKTELTAFVQRAQGFQDARTTVDRLFKTPDTEIKDGLTQSELNAAKSEVTSLMDGAWKTEQLARIQKAQAFFELKATQQAVEDLFKDSSYNELAAPVTQEDIDAANDLVEALPEGAEKEALRELIEKANELAKGFDVVTVSKEYVMGDRTIEGTYGKNIQEVQLEVNGKKIEKRATLHDDGTYTVSGANGWFGATDTVKLLGLDGEGKTLSQADLVIKQEDTTLTIKDHYTMGDQTIEGTYGRDIVRIRLEVNGSLINKSGTLDGSGNYTISGVNGWFGATDTVKVVAFTANGYAVKKDLVIKEEDRTLTIKEAYTPGDKTIEGTYGKDIVRIRLEVNGSLVNKAGILDGDGNYTISGVNGWFTDEDTVKVVGYSVSGTVVKQDLVITKEDQTLTISEEYVSGTRTIEGTYGAGISKIQLEVNGTLVNKWGILDGKGNYTMSGVNGWFSTEDTVNVVGTTQSGKTIKVPLVMKKQDTTVTVTNEYIMGDKTIEGTYGKDIIRIRLEVNGSLVNKSGTLDGDGNYTIYGVNGWFAQTDEVKVVGFTAAGYEVKTPVTIKK
ncbi:hypothetical protein FDP48_12205 [Enterococcus faecalis]|uniref:toxin Cry1Ac domain D-VI-related protein n=1 Tax=Enterococcus faecalis TaxID=1351 RepID=UPI00129C86EB|nr:toxin Cry1Ac domain D-VI-related protein [Enterococcus faecalis]MRJ30701.1 hypothetical protein [Enterococcus faecalis]